ncbi:MAG: oligosaccharide flippase family protein [Fibrobacter sp.]|nr:oligosaccharide flippase family protein [Fibrobacter sp.]
MFQAFRNIRIGVFIAFVNLLIQGISFFVQNFIARNLGTASYGYFGLLQTDFSIFCAIADFGMTTLILAFFGSRATKGSLFRSILQLRLFSAVAAALLMVAFAFTFRYNHPIFYGELIFTFGLVFQHAFFDWYFICGKFWKRLFVSKLLHTISYSAVMGLTLLYFKIERIELIALSMVLAALPAFFYGVTQAFNAKLLKISHRTFRFIALMIKAGIPYAISSFASFAYLPLGLYVADKFASNEFLGCYNFGHKILLLCSSIMVHFISSNLITLHSTHDKDIHLRDIAIFTLFIAVCSSPLWIFPSWILQILFFAANWTEATLQTSAHILQILSFSLIFQATRTTLISTLLKEHATPTYALMISIGGIANIIVCGLAGMYLENELIPLFALTGDFLLTAILFGYFIRNKRMKW